MAAPNDLTLLRCELAIGVDLATDPTTWAFTDMAAPASITALPVGARGRLFEDAIPIRVGQSGEASQVTPSTVTFELDNSDGWLTPDNPMSPWWPHIAVGLPCRLSVLAGSPFLRAVGSAVTGATSVDHADFDITGDLTARAEIVYYGTPTLPAFLVSKYVAAGNQRSWLWWIDIDGHVVVRTSPDGTLASAIETRSAEPIPRFGKMAVGIQVDVNNGAGGHTVRFEIAETIDTPDVDWVDLGAPVINVGTTSLFNSTSPVQVCQQTLYPVRKARLYSGLGSGGSLRANPDFTAQTPGVASFNDTTSSPKPWVVNGEITGWHTRFFGAVSEVTLLAPHGRVTGTQRVRVTAAGELRRLDVGNKPLRSAITRIITSPANTARVVAHWPHEDGERASRIASSTPGVASMSIKGTFSLAADDSVLGSAPLLSIGSGQNAFRTADIPQIPQVPGVVWEVGQFIVDVDPTTGSPGTQIFAVDTNGRVATWRVNINDTQLTVTGLDDDAGGVVLATLASAPTWFDGTSIVVLRVADNGANVDWKVAVITTDVGFLYSASGSFVGDTGVPFRLRNSCTGPPGGITIGHTFVTTGTNLAGGVPWFAPADTGFRGETDVERAIRLCAEEGVPLAYVGDPARGVRMGPQSVATLDTLLRECADTGLATFGEQIVGPGLTWPPHAAHYNQETRLLIDGTDKARNLDFPFELVTDDKRLRTHIIAARPDGSERTVIAAGFDADRDPVRDERVEVNVADDAQLPDQASWRLHVAGSTQPRCPAINTLLSEGGVALQDEFLALAPGDRVQVVNLPPGYPPDGVDQLVTGWTESVSLALWRAQLTGVPADPYEIALRDDPVRGRRDTAGSVLNADFAAGVSTTMSVATTLGPLWSTSVPVPFELWVGGARVTVTAIGAPAGQIQTFTVSTTIANGVVKTIPAGTTVRLWRTPIRALL